MMSTKKSDPQLFDKSNTTVPGNTYLRLVKILSHFEFLLTKLQNEYFWIFLILFVVLKFCRSLKNWFLPFRDVANIKERYISLCIPLKECEKNKIREKLQKSRALRALGFFHFSIFSWIFSFFHTFLKVRVKKNIIQNIF